MEDAEKRELPSYSRAEVSKHNSHESNWIVVDDFVYDVTKFAKFHPGGKQFIDRVAGSDSTNAFYKYHRRDVLETVRRSFESDASEKKKEGKGKRELWRRKKATWSWCRTRSRRRSRRRSRANPRVCITTKRT